MPDNVPDVSIIIVNWNARDLLLRCLASLSGAAGNRTYEVYVVDNASTDGSVDVLQRNYPHVKLISNAKNVGFAAANNQAAQKSRGRYLLCLNPDTELLPQALTALIDYADAHPAIGALGPQLLHRDGTHQRSCWRGYPGLGMAVVDAFYLWKMPGLPIARRFEYRPDELLIPRQVDHLLGACLLIRRAAWQSVGAFDEGYFIFLEETEWCYRAQRAGWQIVYQPDIHIIHIGQHSVRQEPVSNASQYYRSYCRFYRAHHQGQHLGLLILKIVILFAVVIRIGLWSIRVRRVKGLEAQQLSRKMIAGYRQVWHDLRSF